MTNNKQVKKFTTLPKEDLQKVLSKNLKNSDPLFAIANEKQREIQKYISEYHFNDRELRETQVRRIQLDKTTGEGESLQKIIAIKTEVPYQKRIVRTSVAFEFGNSILLTPKVENPLTQKILEFWDNKRVDDLIMKAKIIQKSQTQAAFLFSLEQTDQGQDLTIKVLSSEEGLMNPLFDYYKNMIGFSWSFKTKSVLDNKDTNHVWIWDDQRCYKFSDRNKTDSGDMTLEIPGGELHGFTKIPVVYIDQEFPEWWDVRTMIDRFEVCVSKLSESNDRTGYPILKVFGEVANLPKPGDNGKVLEFEMKEPDEAGRVVHGDAEYLTYSNAPESIKLEMDKYESLIHALTSTPNLSFDNLKGQLDNISGIAMRFMFIDSEIKAKMNEGENRTMLKRMLNLISDGLVKTATILKKDLAFNKFDIKFNSIIPKDLKEAVEIVLQAREAGVMSVDTGVRHIGVAKDYAEELIRIEKEVTRIEESKQTSKNDPNK